MKITLEIKTPNGVIVSLSGTYRNTHREIIHNGFNKCFLCFKFLLHIMKIMKGLSSIFFPAAIGHKVPRYREEIKGSIVGKYFVIFLLRDKD